MAIANMLSRRSSAGVAVLEGMLYVAGGNDGTSCLNSVERFNPKTNAWEGVAPMNIRRWAPPPTSQSLPTTCGYNFITSAYIEPSLAPHKCLYMYIKAVNAFRMYPTSAFKVLCCTQYLMPFCYIRVFESSLRV